MEFAEDIGAIKPTCHVAERLHRLGAGRPRVADGLHVRRLRRRHVLGALMETLAELTQEYARVVRGPRRDRPHERRRAPGLGPLGARLPGARSGCADFIERWDFAQQFEGSKFSDVLEAFLAYRATKPDESDGYTDKAWYRRGARLAKALDSFFTKET
jgi:hypothetical protein